jgi:hypothetical protein
MEHYSIMKKNEIMSFAENMGRTGDHYVKRNKED